MICDGICEISKECVGKVTKVHIYGIDGKDWGTFYYCEAAINKDIKNGFNVTKIGD